MRRIVAYLVSSLDGVVEAPERWIGHVDDEFRAHLGELIAEQDAVLLGRATYQQWSAYWPSADDEPFASFINNTRKYVVSSAPPDRGWAHTVHLGGDLPAQLAALRHQPGRTIGVHGSPTLVRSLLRRGLVDELRLALVPVVARDGARLFDGQVPPQQLQLDSLRRTGRGVLLVGYRAAAAGAGA